MVRIEAKRSPRKKPSVGIKNWKPPNHSPQVMAWAKLTLRTERPLQIETAKASMERLMAIRIRSNNVMVVPPFCKGTKKDLSVRTEIALNR